MSAGVRPTGFSFDFALVVVIQYCCSFRSLPPLLLFTIAIMSGLEVIALVPIGIAGWKLFQKVGDQQSLIAQHEVTINSQREMLESIMNAGRAGPLSRLNIAVVAVTLVLAGTVTYKGWTLTKSRTVRPPPNYEPTQATFDAEQCVICLENCKDTVFLPCRHLCACWNCACRVGNSACPTCRAPIEAMQFVYQQ